jgi:hypothetical protein
LQEANAGPSTRPGAPGLAQDDVRIFSLRMTANLVAQDEIPISAAQDDNSVVMQISDSSP